MEQKRQKGGTIAGALGAGFISGMFSTAVLNPYDRALFLAVSNSRPFMCAANFRSPFAGLSQTLFSRSVSTGLWFPLEDLSHRLLRDRLGLRGTLENALSGQMAGAANAALLNPLHVVKFRTWGLPDHERNILRAARDIYAHGGALAFTRGMKATMARDMVFGMTYSSLRRYASSKQQQAPTAWRRSREFAVNAASAAVATVVSGPFNYVRNVQFAKVRGWRRSARAARARHALSLRARASQFGVDERPPSIREALRYFAHEAQAREGVVARLRYVQTRLMIGWGTLRVASGMAITALGYSALLELDL